MFLIFAGAPDFPKQKGSYEVALSFDGQSPVFAAGLGEDGHLQLPIGSGETMKLVTSSSRVSISAGGVTHEYSLRNAALALDGAARCAGQQPVAQRIDRPAQPIPGADGWTLSETLPGVSARVCQARIAGDEIDTMLILNNADEVVLIGGHSNWATFAGETPVELSVDGGPPVNLTASRIQNLVLVRLKDAALVERLRTASNLDWGFPTGHVHGEVTGFGLALDAVRRCKAAAK